MANRQTTFTPISHGYEFVNFFEFKLPVKFRLPLAGEVDLNDVVFGLCGGMCYSALDYYYAKKGRPGYNSPKEIEIPLMSYLVERQVDSLSLPVVIKIIDWTSRGDDELASRMLRTELPRLRRILDKGDPAVLCLIRAGAGGNLTQNHQVVAIGYDLDTKPGQMVISLYDPNHPLDNPTITVSLAKTNFRIEQSTGEPLRGLFIMPYQVQVRSLPASAQAGEEGISFAAESAAPPPFRLCWPVDSRRVNQFFGENPATYRPFGLPGHEGIDFFAVTGARIYAAFEGTVSEVKYRGAYGNQIRIRHEANGTKFTTVYAHLEKMLAVLNQKVQAGDLIGLADNTGNSRGSHLHFTLFIDGAKTPGYYDGIVDPWFYFEGNEPPAPLELSGVVAYTSQEANLRTLPTTDSEILTRLGAGEVLPVFGPEADVRQKIGRKDTWLQVKTAGGQEGFIAAWLTRSEAQLFAPSGLFVYPFDTLSLRAGPGLGLSELCRVTSETPLHVLGSSDGAKSKIGQKDAWLQALAPDGTSGFVPAWLVRITGANPPPTGLFVTPTGDLNLRAAPSREADIMAVVVPGDILKVVGDKNQASVKIGLSEQWLNVQAPNGVIGWVAAWFVERREGPGAAASSGPKKPQPQPAGKNLTVFPTPQLGINLRASPDVDSPRVDGAVQNEALDVLDSDLASAQAKVGQQGAWLYVQKAGGKRGWVAAWNLSMTNI